MTSMDAGTWVPKPKGTEGLPMFAPAPSVPSPTSEAAADAFETPAGRQRAAIVRMRMLRIIGSSERGATSDELGATMQIGSGTVCPRVTELRAAGLIDTSEEIRRPTRTGKSAAVHFITPAGRQKLEAAA